MPVNIIDNSALFIRKLGEAEKAVGFAQVVALTRTARATAGSATGGFFQEGFLAQEAKRVFDRPTRYTLGGFYWRPATADKKTLEIGVKNMGDKSVPAAKFLKAEILGGQRRAKRSEVALRRSGLLASGSFWVPGAGAKLDAYGNVSGALIRRILSDLKADGEVGYQANRTARSTKRNKRYKQGRYFVPKAGSKLHPGVWERKGTAISPVLLFVSGTHYSKRFQFYERGMAFARQRYPIELDQAMREGWHLPRSVQKSLGLGGRI